MVSVFRNKILNCDLTGAMLSNNLHELIHQIENQPLFHLRGRVLESTSLIIRASVPLTSIGELCEVTLAGKKHTLPAQVVGFRESDVFLMPLGDTAGLSPNSQVIPKPKPFTLKVGYQLLGRVLNGLGQPMDEGPH